MEECNIDKDNDTPRLEYLLSIYEKNIISVALRKHTSIRQTVKTLDIHPSTLSRKIKKHNIKVPF